MQIYCTQSFNSAEILERHSNGCFEINDKKWLKCLKKVKILNLKIMRGKWNHRLWFMIIWKYFSDRK